MCDDWVQKQLEQYKFDFDKADKDKSGSLSFSEVSAVLKAQGFKGSEAEVQAIFKHLDCDGNKSVSKDEFNKAIDNLPKMVVTESYLRKIFVALDKDNSGCLTKSEVMDATKTQLVGVDVSADRISDMLIALVKDDDGKLNYEEFLAVFRRELEAVELRKVFKAIDEDKSGSLTRDEVYKALNANFELKLSVDKICDLVLHLVHDSDKKIDYEEFVQVWLKQK